MSFDQTPNSNSPPKRRRAPRSGAGLAGKERVKEKILSGEEKRSLILAHAAKRVPVDHAQKVSLWAGIAICVLAIGTGWLYSVRLGIAEVFPADKDPERAGSAAWESRLIKQDLRQNAERMLKEIEKIEETQMQGGFGEVLGKTLEMAAEISNASGTNAESKAANLFMKLEGRAVSSTVSEEDQTDFTLPPGLIKDNQ